MEKNTGTTEDAAATGKKTYANLKKTADKHGEIEFSAAIPLEVVEVYVGRALAHAAEDAELPGFRKGKVPLEMVRARVDEMALLEDAADESLRRAVREIVEDETLALAGAPQLTITKIALKNPIEFKVRFALYPEIKLPDYKKITDEILAKKDSAAEVTDADMELAISRLLAMVSPQPTTKDDEKPAETPKQELTDEFVAKLGPFKSVDEFKIKLKENLAQDKAMQAKDAKREEIMHEIVKHASVEMPKMLIDQEWYAFEGRRNEELEEAKLSLEDYLKQMGKTEKQLEKEERELIEERLKTSMVFREIQKSEKIEPAEKEIQTNIAYLKIRYPERGEAWLRETAEAVIVQEKIFAALGLPLAQ